MGPIADMTGFTDTDVPANRISAVGIDMTVMSACLTLIHVCAGCDAISGETTLTGTRKASGGVGTDGVVVTVVSSTHTFVNIDTFDAVSRVAGPAGTRVVSRQVGADGVRVTVVASLAFVNVHTGTAIAGEASLAGARHAEIAVTHVAAVGVDTGLLGSTDVGVDAAFVYV